MRIIIIDLDETVGAHIENIIRPTQVQVGWLGGWVGELPQYWAFWWWAESGDGPRSGDVTSQIASVPAAVEVEDRRPGLCCDPARPRCSRCGAVDAAGGPAAVEDRDSGPYL